MDYGTHTHTDLYGRYPPTASMMSTTTTASTTATTTPTLVVVAMMGGLAAEERKTVMSSQCTTPHTCTCTSTYYIHVHEQVHGISCEYTVGVKKSFRFDVTKRNGVSVPFLPFHLMPPVLIMRARGDCKGREDSKNGSQNDRANRLSASKLLRNLALQLLGPAVNHRALQPALYCTYIAGVWPRRALLLFAASVRKLQARVLLSAYACSSCSYLFAIRKN